MDSHGFFLMFLAISQDFPHVSCFFLVSNSIEIESWTSDLSKERGYQNIKDMLPRNIRSLLEFNAENVEHTSWRSDRDFNSARFGILAS
jgi:hypothetical protein